MNKALIRILTISILNFYTLKLSLFIDVDQFKRDIEENPEEDGYIGQDELDEEGEEYLDDYDEEQEAEFNE